jgi:Cu-processing system ATP-binding protein
MIEVRDLHKHFGAIEVLDGVDIEIRAGRVTAVVGPNGSGKTTLIKAILGLVKPDRGTIVFKGHSLNGDSAYREQVGYMPQIVRFPENLSGRELLSMLEDLRGAPEDVDGELVERFALDKDLEKPFRTLSGGTRQKLNASIAFRFGAELMILDEPTAGLDPVAARILKDKIRRERAAGRTFILTSHIMSELEDLSDDIIFLLDGKVRFQGAVTELLDHTGGADLEEAVAELMTEGGPQ